jgi:hypothetical protein
VKTVWKFPLKADDAQIVAMPANAHILTVQMQYAEPCIWALVNPEMPFEERTILIAGTGHEREDLDGLVNYIGTFQMDGGGLIFHVFERVDFAKIAGAAEVAEAVHG